ncbi:MAG: antifreeze protein, partial [Proteobacteria bacterium]|nr:antifreeze protein [Pseudomonadota bacterium]
PAVFYALRNAADAGRLGETVLLALLALGDAGSEGAGPATLRLVIDALRRVGFAAEARAIALEAALAQGL